MCNILNSNCLNILKLLSNFVIVYLKKMSEKTHFSLMNVFFPFFLRTKLRTCNVKIDKALRESTLNTLLLNGLQM